jgi:hypothetical protein
MLHAEMAHGITSDILRSEIKLLTFKVGIPQLAQLFQSWNSFRGDMPDKPVWSKEWRSHENGCAVGAHSKVFVAVP